MCCKHLATKVLHLLVFFIETCDLNYYLLKRQMIAAEENI